MTTIADALSAYRLCAQAEGRSAHTITWIMSSVGYFRNFLGAKQDIDDISADDLRRFIISLQQRPKFLNHPFTSTSPQGLSPQTIETYARAIRAFFGFLYREELIAANPILKVRMPKVPVKVVPTFSVREVEGLLKQPDKTTYYGFRDYALLLTFIDTGARLSELAELKAEDVDLENGYLKVMGKGGRERFIPFGRRVAKAFLRYRLNFRPDPVGTERFWLTCDGRPLRADRIRKLVTNYGRKAGLKRCYPHKLRHTSSVMYLRNGGDPFSLQKKLGHSSLQMTRHYSNLADSDIRAMHLKYGVADRLNI